MCFEKEKRNIPEEAEWRTKERKEAFPIHHMGSDLVRKISNSRFVFCFCFQSIEYHKGGIHKIERKKKFCSDLFLVHIHQLLHCGDVIYELSF